MSKALAYRPDIDGLRAIAVIAVVAYHYGALWLPGGFTGVDIFFVISGYVITRKIVSDIENRKLSLISFYGARIRRIAPALALVIIVTLAVGWFVLLPAEYAALADSAGHAALGLANVFFFRNTGYFDLSADSQPLLHTWSLGVEEQFYLVWPLFLWAAARHFGPKSIPSTIYLVLIVGLAFAIWQTASNGSAAFYLPFSRAWELALGASIVFVRPVSNPRVANLTAVLGGALVIASLLLIDKSSLFPGLGAVPACIGAALLIIPATHGTFVSRVLSIRALVVVGLASYSLYLWHWPIIVLYRHYTMSADLSAQETAALLVLTSSLTVISYLLVERRIRLMSLAPSATFGLSGTAIVVALSVGITLGNGLPSRLSQEAQTLALASTDISPFRATCHRTFEYNPPLEDSCVFGAEDIRPDAIMWGDSHGVELAEAFGTQLRERSRSIVQATYSSCPPAQNFRSPLQNGCEDFSASMLSYLIEHEEIRHVFLATYYDLYSESEPALWAGLRTTVDALAEAGKDVTIIAPVPNPGYSVPQAAAKRSMTDPSANLIMSRENWKSRSFKVRQSLEALTKGLPSVTFYDPASALCEEQCRMVVDSHPVLFDDNHLSRYGASLVARKYWTSSSALNASPASPSGGLFQTLAPE